MALGLGAVVAGLYRWARRGEPVQATFLTTLVLLATLIAMATQIIGDSVARAFSLVGALSVVRFRTVVKDTQDTAFVIFAVVMGMAAGANHLAVGLIGLAVLAAASLVLWPPNRPVGWPKVEGKLSFRAGLAGGSQAAAEDALARAAGRFQLLSVGTARQGTALDLSYRVRLRPGVIPAALVGELIGIDGIDNVELKRDE